jgi:hypothetical protein
MLFRPSLLAVFFRAFSLCGEYRGNLQSRADISHTVSGGITADSRRFRPNHERNSQAIIEICPDCGGKLRVIACIEEPALIARILG